MSELFDTGHDHAGHDHEEGMDEHTSGMKLAAVFTMNLLITAVEVIGGIVANSLSLFSDALHNFSDATAIAISYVSIKIGQKQRDSEKTFGYRRAEIIAAAINSAVLLGVVAYLLREAYLKFMNPSPIRGGVMFGVATVGLIANSISVLLLHPDSKNSLNIRAAYLHLLADAISSLAVIGAGLAIYFLEIFWLDPLITIGLALYVAREAIDILSEATHIVMQGTPRHIDHEDIKRRLEELENVKDVHHTHIWSLSRRDVFLETHVKIEDMLVSEAEEITDSIEKILEEEYGITHLTVQYEHEKCDEAELM